jgi:hypothetical protein
MDVFRLRDEMIRDYEEYARSFVDIRDDRIRETVDAEIERGLLWPEPLVQLNPSFETGSTVDDLVDAGTLHQRCRTIFRRDKTDGHGGSALRLYRHQEEALHKAREGRNYVLTTGTGSGKSLAYIIPIVDAVLRAEQAPGIKAIVVYPMNALANSQEEELAKFLGRMSAEPAPPVTYRRYTGQESQSDRDEIRKNPPDILLTNFVMLELILTRVFERDLIASTKSLQFLVLDELHTYRGRQGADVAMLVRRLREYSESSQIRFVGTSATIAGAGTRGQQQAEIAAIGTRIFGDTVEPSDIVGESLRRITNDDSDTDAFTNTLARRLSSGEATAADFAGFRSDPLAMWAESTFGVRRVDGGLTRATPVSIDDPTDGAATRLGELTGVDAGVCGRAIREVLSTGANTPNTETPEGGPAFAFRLHQFISRGDNVYATVESEATRHIAVEGQRLAPGRRPLLPICFCRECGQEYYTVRQTVGESGDAVLAPRDLGDGYSSDDEGDPGFLYISTRTPWPEDTLQQARRVPADWLDPVYEEPVIASSQRKYVPRNVTVTAEGIIGPSGHAAAWLPAPFRFCLECGVSYSARLRSDLTKLAMLGAGGRSTATTVLGMKVTLEIRKQARDLGSGVPPKMLSFTDNRQDASLQAGHFNDFVHVGLIRGALVRAVKDAPDGIRHNDLTRAVADALGLPFEAYARNPEARFGRAKVDQALRNAVGYELYLDLRRGWRVTSPNLEQCGLLRIEYEELAELCEAEDVWETRHAALSGASPEIRHEVLRVLLDHMRRELAINVVFLDPERQDGLRSESDQNLADPWALDMDDQFVQWQLLYPRPARQGDRRSGVLLSARGGYGLYLGRPTTLSAAGKLTMQEREQIIAELIEALCLADIVERVQEPRDDDDVPGYQLKSGSLIWRAGDGQPVHDPIRIPTLPEGGGRVNEYFRRFYEEVGAHLLGIEAREHTAQVTAEERIEREERFRENRLPILFCSPTMELGVDISELNVVNMRNVPPTPANYAQRSGRAGRGGQPAFVFTYCAGGSPHDQFFFRQPEQMVAGQVQPPRIDLTNEDLLLSHVHAMWLHESRLDLGSTLTDVVNIEDDALPLHPSVQEAVASPSARDRAVDRAANVLASIRGELAEAEWYDDDWLHRSINAIPLSFNDACQRWRTLYQSAMSQRDTQHRVIGDASRTPEDRRLAHQLRRDAEGQLELLRDTTSFHSDFYTYRYFASEGFLPGYNFPRLPLSAFIPARRRQSGRNDFLSRPRFLAIAEFGPRAMVYHEGRRYRIDRVIIPTEARGEGEQTIARHAAKTCKSCGYLHHIGEPPGPDVCDHCGGDLDVLMPNLFRLENVETRRRDRITSDEEERFRRGYELRTAYRFAERDGSESCHVGEVVGSDGVLARLAYGDAATLWRINYGWRRRKTKEPGFNLDLERGWWDSRDMVEEDGDDPSLSNNIARVIPYVEDRKNLLLFQPTADLDATQMASLQAAMKTAIQSHYQIEEGELAAEPLPSEDDRQQIMFYEASEGGAGVLKRLVAEPDALASVARQALRACHFDPVTGDDLGGPERRNDDCVAACYDCLMSYQNQRDHALLDRDAVQPLLMAYASSTVPASPTGRSRGEQMDYLLANAGSDLEQRWLRWLDGSGHRLPTDGQVFIEACNTKPDFVYADKYAVVYIDGPHHSYPERQRVDATQTEALEDRGYIVIRFRADSDAAWEAEAGDYPSVFGTDA